MKTNVKIGGKKITIDTNKPKVAQALTALVEACATPVFKVGTVFEHENGQEYILACIRSYKGATGRAYLVNLDTGRARNSTKVVRVQGDFKSEDGLYVEDLPCEKDKFYDPDNDGVFLDV